MTISKSAGGQKCPSRKRERATLSGKSLQSLLEIVNKRILHILSAKTKTKTTKQQKQSKTKESKS